MTALHEAISEYLTLRRALGFKLAGQDRLLADFVDHLEQTGAAAITVEAAVTWAIKPATAQPIRWRARLCVVRGFARYLSTVDPTVEVPAVDVLPHRHHRPTPYLFSPADIAALLAATNQIRSPLLALTYRVLFGLLAATGMRVSEAIRLDDADVDLTAGLVSIRQTKFNKSPAAAPARHDRHHAPPLRRTTRPAWPQTRPDGEPVLYVHSGHQAHLHQ